MGISERKEREKEQRRNAIIDAAEKVFFSKGFELATMEEVAEQAELSKGTLYLYFKNKEELQLAISIRGLIQLRKIFEESIDPGKSTWENLLAIGRGYVKFSRKYPDYLNSMLYMDAKHVDHALVEASFQDNIDPMEFFVKFIEKGIDDGSIRKDLNPKVLAHLLWSSTTGVLRLINKFRCIHGFEEYSEEELLETHLEIITHGIHK